jgi:hypothetical protein
MKTRRLQITKSAIGSFIKTTFVATMNRQTRLFREDLVLS